MHAKFIEHARFIQRFVFHGIDQRDAFTHKLRHIFIACGYNHLHIRIFSLLCQRANHIIRLYITDF